jgi:hypothetical protein
LLCGAANVPASLLRLLLEPLALSAPDKPCTQQRLHPDNRRILLLLPLQLLPPLLVMLLDRSALPGSVAAVT